MATRMDSIPREEGLAVAGVVEEEAGAVEDEEVASMPTIPHQIEELDPTMPLSVPLVACPRLLR